jgi:hypothetical protein
MRCPWHAPRGWYQPELNPRARGALCRPAGESRTEKNPRTPSVVYGAREPRPANREAPTFDRSAHLSHRFAIYPPVPRVREASSFLPASAPARHEALRPPGGRDARCIQPTSATRTNCVYPYLARSRPAAAIFTAWGPTESWAPWSRTGGRGVSRHPHPLRRIAPNTTTGSASRPPRGGSAPRGDDALERGRCLPTVLDIDRASDTPVASSSCAETGAAFAVLRLGASCAIASSVVRKPPRPP